MHHRHLPRLLVDIIRHKGFIFLHVIYFFETHQVVQRSYVVPVSNPVLPPQRLQLVLPISTPLHIHQGSLRVHPPVRRIRLRLLLTYLTYKINYRIHVLSFPLSFSSPTCSCTYCTDSPYSKKNRRISNKAAIPNVSYDRLIHSIPPLPTFFSLTS